MALPASLGATVPCVATAARAALVPALALMFLSGAAGLTWQMVWSAQLGVALGHEMVAVLAVLAAFFGGMAGGSFLLGAAIERSARPAAWYAGLEALVALWALLVLLTFEQALPHVARAIGPEPSVLRHWAIAFFLPFVLLLPATVAMGATLPALERALRGSVARALGAVYACNTAGALAGLLFAVFHAIPQWGLRQTTLAFAGVNALCALAAWLAWRGQRLAVAAVVTAADGAHGLRWRLFCTGLLGIGYEVLVLRVLSQVTENTVYTYALLLALFLLGTAAGAAGFRRVQRAALDTDWLLAALVLAMAAGAASLWQADRIVAGVAALLGSGAAAALAGEAASGALALLPASLVMGALFTQLCQQAQSARLPLGQAFGWNTLGSALAPLLVGVLLVPQVGAGWTLAILLLGYLLLRTSRRDAALGAAVIVAALAASPALRFVDVPPGGRIASYREGVLAAVSVVEDAEGVARLHINNRVQEGSSASGLVETRLAQLPLLLHPAPRRALLLGVGTGSTARAAALAPALQVDAVELVPEVIAAAAEFAQAPGAPRAAGALHLVAADARRYVQSAESGYDVIVSDLFHPARSGAGSLYTVEHFAAVRARLRPGGLFCQWLALHQMDLPTLRSIVAAYLQVYPEAVAVLASNSLDTPVIGLVASSGRGQWRPDAITRRLAGSPPALADALRAARLEDGYAVLGSLLAGPAALQRFSAGAVANTDDRPVVSYAAPWTTYAPEAAPRARLAALLEQLQPDAPDVLGRSSPDDARLAAYWQARADYLRVGLALRPQADPHALLLQLRAPLLDVLARSPDFRPAAEPLQALAQAVRADDPALSAQVLQQVRQLRAPSFSSP